MNLYAKTDNRSGKVYYQYRDPRNGSFHSFGTDKQAAIIDANAINSRLYEAIRTARVEAVGKDRLTVKQGMRTYWKILQAERDLKPSTLHQRRHITDMIVRRMGSLTVAGAGVLECAEIVNGYRDQGKGRMAQSVRSVLIDFFRVMVSEGFRPDNPAAATRNPFIKVQRGRLTLETFTAILDAAELPWVRNAMLLALLTAQRREDVAAMRFRDVRDGYLEVTQAKRGARIRIALGLRLEAVGLSVGEVVSQCRDAVVSPHLVHHDRHRGKAKPGQAVHKDTLSRMFAEARAGLPFEGKPPTFHEIRSLAGRLYKAEGRDPQPLLGHKDSRMTDTYLDGRGQDWVVVK